MSLTSLECQVSELVHSDTCPRPTTGGRRPTARAKRTATGRAAGDGRARSHCRVVPPLTHFIPYSLTYSLSLFLKQHCDRTLGDGAGCGGHGQPTGDGPSLFSPHYPPMTLYKSIANLEQSHLPFTVAQPTGWARGWVGCEPRGPGGGFYSSAVCCVRPWDWARWRVGDLLAHHRCGARDAVAWPPLRAGGRRA